MAFDVFHGQVMDTWIEVTDLVLKLRMKLSTHETTWALLHPREWMDVVRDGDEIRLECREVCPGPLIIFKYIPVYGLDTSCKYVTIRLR